MAISLSLLSKKELPIYIQCNVICCMHHTRHCSLVAVVLFSYRKMKERRACTDYRPLHNAAFCQNIVWGQFWRFRIRCWYSRVHISGPFWAWCSCLTTLSNQTGLFSSIPHLPAFGYLTGWRSTLCICNLYQLLENRNPTIFKIIWWDNGSMEWLSRRLMLHCLFW